MDRDIAGQPTADYLWTVKRVVPFLKVDEGLAAEKDGVQLMRPMPALAARLGEPPPGTCSKQFEFGELQFFNL